MHALPSPLPNARADDSVADDSVADDEWRMNQRPLRHTDVAEANRARLGLVHVYRCGQRSHRRPHDLQTRGVLFRYRD